MKHKCNYCDTKSNNNRDALVEAGWTFADIRAPKRKYIQSCHNPLCQDKMHDEINEIFGGKWCGCGDELRSEEDLKTKTCWICRSVGRNDKNKTDI